MESSYLKTDTPMSELSQSHESEAQVSRKFSADLEISSVVY